MNLVIGARGRLGRAIASALPSASLVLPEREVYSDWWRKDHSRAIADYFEPYRETAGTIYIAAGLINPQFPAEEHYRVNYLLPKHIIEAAAPLGLQVITFGTVMEKVVRPAAANPYIAAKQQLARFVEEYATAGHATLHIRIHTLYGGPPPTRFMFLGQILDAIQAQGEFKMTPGLQLREYHHLDDEVTALRRLASLKLTGSLDLSHGAPLPLKDLATHIFHAFGCADLLKIGALPEPINDNYGIIFERTPQLGDMAFRPTLPAIVAYLHSCAAYPETQTRLQE